MAQPTARDYAHSIGRSISSVQNADFDTFPAIARNTPFTLRSVLPTIAGTTTTGATAYFVFLGTTQRRLTAQKVQFWVSTAGASTQAGEVGLFSTTAAPNGSAQTLTKLMATGTLDDLTGTGIKGNTTAFATDVPAGTHLWAGYRVDMASTEPTVYGLTFDMSRGAVLSLASATAFTSASSYAGALITASVAWQAPALILTCT